MSGKNLSKEYAKGLGGPKRPHYFGKTESAKSDSSKFAKALTKKKKGFSY